MNFFSAPADFKEQTIDNYERFNQEYKGSKLSATYGNVTINSPFGSGREINKLPQISLEKLREYIQYSQKRDIDFYYTLNTSFMNNNEFTKKGIREIDGFLKKLHHIGVRTLIIALPTLLEIVKMLPYDFKIKASVLSQITNPNKAEAFQTKGVSGIVVDESINRDFFNLKKIANVFHGEVEIIVNSPCFIDCEYKMFHYNQISGDSVKKIKNDISCYYYKCRDVSRFFENINNFFRSSWIRPEDLKYYNDVGIHHFKIQGRHAALVGDIAKTVEVYMREKYDGDFFDLIYLFNKDQRIFFKMENKNLDGFIDPFIKKRNFCEKNCGACNYCDSFARKVLKNYDELLRLGKKTNEGLLNNDPFRQMVTMNLKRGKSF